MRPQEKSDGTCPLCTRQLLEEEKPLPNPRLAEIVASLNLDFFQLPQKTVARQAAGRGPPKTEAPSAVPAPPLAHEEVPHPSTSTPAPIAGATLVPCMLSPEQFHAWQQSLLQSNIGVRVGEEKQPSSRLRSSSFLLDARPASLTSAGGPNTRTYGLEIDGSKGSFCAQIQTASKEFAEMGAGKAAGRLKNSPGNVLSGSRSTGSTSAASPSDSSLSELSDASDAEDDRSRHQSSVSSDDEEDEEDLSRPLVPTPSHDHRPPVVDSYDVVEAVKHFASQRPVDVLEQQKQAAALWLPL
eukprot:g29614.t1